MPARDADVELTELGRAQARALGEWLADQPNRPDASLASPFERTVQTAEQVRSAGLTTLPLSVDERLRDRDMGILEELTWDGIRATFPAEAERAVRQGFFYYRPPGGESWADICLRLRSFYADLARLPCEGVLIVAHDIVVQLSVALLTGLNEQATVHLVRSTTYANCGLAQLVREGSTWQVLAYNDTVPVREQGAPATKEPDASDALT
jgi:broad specificity phosphatase PhoE